MLDARISVAGESVSLARYGRAMSKIEREIDISLSIPTKAENRQKSGRVSRRQAEIWRTKAKKQPVTTMNF